MNKSNHLNIYSYYDFLKSTINPDAYLNFLTENKSQIAPLVGYQSVFGLFNFARQALKKNLKPVLGLTIPECKIESHIWEITVYAENFSGYQNLLSISSLLMEKPNHSIKWSEITKFLKNLKIVLNLSKNTTLKMTEQAVDYLVNFKNKLYGGLTEHGLKLDKFQTLFAPKHLLIFYPIRLLHKENEPIYKIINHIKEDNKNEEQSLHYHYWTLEEIIEKTKHKSLIPNWENFTKTIDVRFENQFTDSLKGFKISGKSDNKKKLRDLCQKKLEKKIGNNLIYQKRLEYELKVIAKHELTNYFLIIWDYVKWSRKKNILLGAGRGSATGSLVSYLLEITKMDPIKYGLLFERFLNPERKDVPDVDLDFEAGRRTEVNEYIFKKYPYSGMVSAFQKMGIRLAIRDVGRSLKIPLQTINEISKAIPLQLNISWEKAFAESNTLQKYRKKYPQLFEYAFFLIGFPRQVSTHAAGIVVSSIDLNKLAGTWKDDQGNSIVQLDRNDLSAAKLIKMDILGLRNLTLISNLLDKIGVTENKNSYLEEINLENPKTYKFLRKGETGGIFQLASEGMTNLLKSMKPKNIEDIAITISLFRPGPMQNMRNFLKRKNGLSEVNYLCPEFEPILKNTMGLPIFQEQIIQMLRIFANFSYGKSDIFRKAISKKNYDLVEKFKKSFFEGAKKQKHSLALSKKVWKLLEKFARYGFNRSHALAYAYTAYLMSYFKLCYFPDFMALLLNSVIGDEVKTKTYLAEITEKKITILPPSVNADALEYQTKNNTVRLPLIIIKKIGGVWAKKINSERKKNGKFKSIFDFVARMNMYGLSETIYKQLTYANSFKEFTYNQNTLLDNWERLLLIAKLVLVKKKTINWELLTDKPPTLIKSPKNSRSEWLNEYQAIGFVWNYQDFLIFRENIQKNNFQKNITIKQLIQSDKYEDFPVFFICESINIIMSKKNQEMAFIRVSDPTGLMEIAVFANLWAKMKLEVGQNILGIIHRQSFKGKIKYILVKILEDFFP